MALAGPLSGICSASDDIGSMRVSREKLNATGMRSIASVETMAPTSSNLPSLSELPQISLAEEESSDEDSSHEQCEEPQISRRESVFGFPLADPELPTHRASHMKASEGRSGKSKTVFGFPIEDQAQSMHMVTFKRSSHGFCVMSPAEPLPAECSALDNFGSMGESRDKVNSGVREIASVETTVPTSSNVPSLSELPQVLPAEQSISDEECSDEQCKELHMSRRQSVFGFPLAGQTLNTRPASHTEVAKGRIDKPKTVFGFPVEGQTRPTHMTTCKSSDEMNSTSFVRAPGCNVHRTVRTVFGYSI